MEWLQYGKLCNHESDVYKELLSNKYKMQNCINYDYNYVKETTYENKRLKEMHSNTNNICIK